MKPKSIRHKHEQQELRDSFRLIDELTNSKSTLNCPLLDTFDGEIYEGHSLFRAEMPTIWAIGNSPQDAINNFCLNRMGDFVDAIGEELKGGDERYDWGYRFTCNGTGFKAAGIYITGYAVLTWWK